MLCAIGLGKGELAFRVFGRMLLVCLLACFGGVEEKENRIRLCRVDRKRMGDYY